MAESIQGNNSFDNSDLRGVLFKPGHYAPVTAEIDVAPHLSMIRGKETPHATQKRSDARQRRPKESHQQRANYLGNGSSAHPLAANLLTRRDITATVTAPSVEARGTVVPVVLEPVEMKMPSSPIREEVMASDNENNMMIPIVMEAVEEDEIAIRMEVRKRFYQISLSRMMGRLVLPPSESSKKEVLRHIQRSLRRW
ncbi:hypothetical protein ACET3Z_028892 [Daucus carota]